MTPEEIAKYLFPFVLLAGAALIMWRSHSFMIVQQSFVPIMLIMLVIPSVVFLGVFKLLSQDAIVAIIGSVVGYSLGSLRPPPGIGPTKPESEQ